MVLKVQYKYLRKYKLHAWVILFFFVGAIITLNAQTTKQPPRSEGYSIGYAGINQLHKMVGIQYDAQVKNLFLPEVSTNFNARLGAVLYIKPFILGAVGYGYAYTDPNSAQILEPVPQSIVFGNKWHFAKKRKPCLWSTEFDLNIDLFTILPRKNIPSRTEEAIAFKPYFHFIYFLHIYGIFL